MAHKEQTDSMNILVIVGRDVHSWMIMPKESIEVKDDEDISLVLSNSSNRYSEFSKAAKDNQVLLNISNYDIMKIFKDQYYD